jgi:hypothetical protein
VISWLTSGSGWGTREQAIPGEWAALVLIMVLGALLGLLVLWFTVLRHERTVRHRAALRPGLGSGIGGMVAFAGLGAAADEKGTPTDPEAETAAEAEAGEAEAEPDSGLEDADEDAEVDVDGRSTRGRAGSMGPTRRADADEVGEVGESKSWRRTGDGDEGGESDASKLRRAVLSGRPPSGASQQAAAAAAASGS